MPAAPGRSGWVVMARWWSVGLTGVACGAVVGWLLFALTGSWPAALVVGAGVASILLGLAVGGARYNQRYAAGAARLADARARRDRVHDAMQASRRKADEAPETDR